MNDVLGHDSALVRLHWAGDKLGDTVKKVLGWGCVNCRNNLAEVQF